MSSGPVHRSVLHAWRSAVSRHADRPAVRDGRSCWTFAELDRRSAAWRAGIADLASSETIVAIQLPHGAEIVAAALGVLTAGHAFLALDPSQPLALRLAQLDVAGATILLSTAADAESIRAAGWNGNVIDPGAVSGMSNASSPTLAIDGGALACLYFTSGSAGRPKAVAWPHRTLNFAAEILQAMLALAPGDRHALLAPLAIASTPAQVLAALAAGAQLCLFEARQHNSAELAAWIRRESISTIQTIPSLFRALAREAQEGDSWPALRAVKLGGEPVTASDVQLFASVAAPGARLINGLGLTEAGFNVCWHSWNREWPLERRSLPLGAPPAGVELELAMLPEANSHADGVGEILIRSPMLANGYWRDNGRTAGVYRDLPDRPGWRELRTGDLGRLRADGHLEYLGRCDDLIKVRGQRVHPAEVEAVLAALPGIARAIALPRRDGEEVSLVAFVETHEPALTPQSIHEQLSTLLPEVCLPATIDIVADWPRLPGGKIDRKALLGRAPASKVAELIAPRDALEKSLHAMFHQVLPRATFGVTESFFALGGDSLRAARLFAAIARVWRIELPLAEIKAHPTIEQLAARIREGGWNFTDNPLALLTPNPDAGAVTLFAWPGAGSDVMTLSDLARHVGPTVSLYALQYRGVDGRRVYDLTVEAIAERGIEWIQRVQPHGPYALCGTSFGGRIALEAAARLRARGQTVSFVALLDTYSPGYPPLRKDLSIAGYCRYLLRALKPPGRRDEPGGALLWRGLRQQLPRLIARLVIGRPKPEAPPLPSPARYLYMQEACFRAGRRTRPTPYDGNVHLFRVESPPPADLFALDEFLGWRRWLTGRIIADVIPGRHGLHLSEPNVQTLATKLRAALFDATRSHHDHNSTTTS